MSVFKEIKEMADRRLAYRLWLVEEDGASLVYTDKRALAFIRIMSFFFSAATFGAIFFISTKEDVPFAVYLILGFFFLSFFLVFILKSFHHKEVIMTSFDKKIMVRKKRFNSVLTETSFGFNSIKTLTLSSVNRIETKNIHGQRTRPHYELVLEFSDGRNIHFSVITDPGSALESSNKLADFVGVKLISRICTKL